ncbi:MAG: Mg-chelatase subunit ChlD [Hyphomicrobiaceae bacterium]
MLILTTIVALLLAALGLAAVRTAPALARWLALLAAVAFAVVVSLADNTAERDVAMRSQSADLAGTAQATRTAMLLAAAAAGPRVSELQLRWQPSWQSPESTQDSIVAARDPGGAALGAVAMAPVSLPFAPSDVRIRAISELRVDRPALLEVEVVGLDQPLAAKLSVQGSSATAYRDELTVGATPVAVAFTPAQAGRHEVSLKIRIGGHEVSVSGGFDVVEPEEVLVVDPSGVVAAALRVQGERVRESQLLPSDWSKHSRIVLGRALPVSEQQALVRAVHDGTGLFVLAGGFGADGSPLRELLPIRVLPELPDDANGEGASPGGTEQPRDQPPPENPPVDAPIDPPVVPPGEPEKPLNPGSTKNAKPVSSEPIEVDKHSIAMVLVVDRSGSMGTRLRNGLTKMSYAKTSALRTAQALDRGDRVGVVSFGDVERARVELPMTDATEQGSVQAGIERLAFFNEYTYLLKGLRLAHGMLANEQAAVKHVVVISDGEFNVQQSLRREAFLMSSRGKITVSIISIIDEHTDAGFQAKAKDIADDGGGMFIATANVEAVPVIVSSEVTRALQRVGRTPRTDGNGNQPEPKPPEQEPDEPKPEQPKPEQPKPDEPEPSDRNEPKPQARLQVHAVTTSPLLEPEPNAWPTLGSAVRSEAPLESRVLLVAGNEGWPLLAYANRGLGRVGAFGADLGGDSGREFREASAFPGWLAQWLRATSAARETVQSKDLREHGDVAPRAPVPADVRWLRRVGGGELLASASPPEAPAVLSVTGLQAAPIEGESTVGTTVVRQVARAAPVLLLILLLLAIAEHCISRYALRRGRS